jgi:hypothetical protein
MNSEPTIQELQELVKLAEDFASNARDLFEEVVIFEQLVKLQRMHPRFASSPSIPLPQQEEC